MKKAIERNSLRARSLHNSLSGALLRAGLVLCTVISLLQPSIVAALGLGEMEVRSYLYERFDASIPVISETRVDPAQLKVALGSIEDFRRAGVARPYYLNSLKFDLVYKGGKNQLRVTSPEVLREPFLNFLLEVRWPGGKMLKEYTVFVDPRSSQQVVQPVPASASSQQSSPVEPPVYTASNAGQSEPVVTSPTSSEVAPAKKFQGSAADLLPSAKPQSKAVRAPATSSDQEITQVDGVESTDGTEGTAESAVAAASDSNINEVKEQTASAGLQESADNRQLQADLARSLENLDKAKVENQQLEQRIQSVESQVEDFERLIELKNREIDAVTESIESKQQQLSTSSIEPEPVSRNTDGNQIATKAASADAGSSNIVSGFLGQFSLVTLLIILGGVLLLIVLVVLFVRGRKSDYQATVFEADDESGYTPASVPAGVSEPEDDIAEAQLLEADAEHRDSDEQHHSPDVVLDSETENSASEQAALDEPEDPVAEADIYMAYGRHAQAVSMLKHAIEDEPQRTDLRLKLLEVLKDEGTLDENTYLVEAQRQQILNDAPELESEVNALLSDGEESIQPVDSDEDLSLDVELDTDLAAAPEQPPEPVDATVAVDSEELAEEVNTKLELARTYFDMGDFNGAKEILLEVVEEGNTEQQAEAQSLLSKIA